MHCITTGREEEKGQNAGSGKEDTEQKVSCLRFAIHKATLHNKNSHVRKMHLANTLPRQGRDYHRRSGNLIPARKGTRCTDPGHDQDTRCVCPACWAQAAELSTTP